LRHKNNAMFPDIQNRGRIANQATTAKRAQHKNGHTTIEEERTKTYRALACTISAAG
jgi:hypothetical protein